MAQLLICDWLLETRVSIWEDSSENDSFNKPVSNTVLTAFQKDLSSLRTLTQHVPVSKDMFCGKKENLLCKCVFSLHYREYSYMKLLPV